jgi:hypothetical protein
MQSLDDMLSRLRKWADENKSFFIIASGTIIVITFIAEKVWPGAVPIVSKLASLLSLLLDHLIQYAELLLASLIRYAEIIQWVILIAVAISVFLFYRVLSSKTFTRRPRYVLTQGGTIAEPAWEFDLVVLFSFSTKGNTSEYGLLRTSGGAGFKNLTKDKKKQWDEFTIALNEDKRWTPVSRQKMDF